MSKHDKNNDQEESAVNEMTEGQTPKLKGKEYMRELRKLQRELCVFQDWVKHTGQRVVIVFEGCDPAGKRGTNRALTERVSPRVFRLVALPAPTDREKPQIYLQRYLSYFPAAGEVVIFDRSWYNRARVECGMGFCSKEQHSIFLENCPRFESYIVAGGIKRVKYWLEVSKEEQKQRFEARMDDPLRQWKLSAVDLPSRERWYDYPKARVLMLEVADPAWAPWYIARSDDKERARLNGLSHFLSLFPCEPVPQPKVKLPKRPKEHVYDGETPMKNRCWIQEKY